MPIAIGTPTLFKAILAMDTYNGGYFSRVIIPGDGASLGAEKFIAMPRGVLS
jgi:hypothetical protein